MLPEGYQLRVGSGKDRALLLQFMSWNYQELFPHQQDFSHLADTLEKYFSLDMPPWWIESAVEGQKRATPVACLWMGNSIDQVRGDRYAHIFLLYVTPQHRRRGIGTALMNRAQDWAKARGDRQISIQVFQGNQSAINLYRRLGYQTWSLLMVKPLGDK